MAGWCQTDSCLQAEASLIRLATLSKFMAIALKVGSASRLRHAPR